MAYRGPGQALEGGVSQEELASEASRSTGSIP